MAVGSYGIVRPADVSPADVEIFYHYAQNRTTTALVTFTKLNAEDVLTPVYHNENTDTSTDGSAANNEILGGLYNLKLKAENFSELGIYTLHLRPKQIRTSITDCGILASLPSVRGLIVDLSNVPVVDRNRFTPQGLVGYRVEYLDTNKKKVPNFYRVVTSSFFCQPVVSNLNNGTDKAVRYQYTDQTTNLVFLTITPSSAPSSRPNVVPFIGQPGQSIILTNTYFNPTTIEVEMVEHDASTLAHALYGNQTKAVSQGIYTIYDNNNDNAIYKQYNLYEVKDQFNETLYEVREERDIIDESLDFNNITE
jgi:hypothetical protein